MEAAKVTVIVVIAAETFVGCEQKGGNPMTRKEILAAAEKCVCGDREQDHGSPENNFRLIAEFWHTYLSAKCVAAGVHVQLEPEDVAAMMALLKIARLMSNPEHADSWIDGAGYLACGGEVATLEAKG